MRSNRRGAAKDRQDRACFVDNALGQHSRFLTAGELRLQDVFTCLVDLVPGQPFDFGQPGRAFFVHALQGAIQIERSGYEPFSLQERTSAGIERATVARMLSVEQGRSARVFLSSVSHKQAYIRELPQNRIMVSDADGAVHQVITATVSTLETVLTVPEVSDGVIRRLCEIITLQLFSLVQQRMAALAPFPTAIEHDAYLLRAWVALLSRPQLQWTNMALAQESGLSRSAFIERFRNAFGEPPMMALRRLRLSRASELLQTSNVPVSEVADRAGYSSGEAFSRAFVRIFGMTPTQWRCSTVPRKNRTVSLCD